MHNYRQLLSSLLPIAILLAAISSPALCATTKVESLYKTFCYSCHGPNMNGGLGGSLIDDEWKHGSTDADIAKIIREGLPDKGMPPWGKTLNEEQIRAMVIYIREKGQQARNSELLKNTTPQQGVFSSEKHRFVMEPFASNFRDLWAGAFLPDGSLLVTEKSTGKLWQVKGDKRVSVAGVPKVWPESQGGLLDVRVLPQTAAGAPWVYLSFSEEKNGRGMTAIVRGKIIDQRWQQQQDIFRAPEDTFLPGGIHFGSRIVFKDNYLFFSIGDRRHKEMAQDLSKPNGKIHRLLLDGKIPNDNPFVGKKNALPSIWSYGHRNPQGMTLSANGTLWETEHGPRGGDEINIIRSSTNYGWPEITYGMNYNGTPITGKTAAPGMEQPVYYWTPSIAVTGIEEYTGSAFPQWKNNLLVGSLAKQELQRFSVNGNKVGEKEVLFKNQGRIRDLFEGPDGLIYLVINTASSPRKGTVYRLKPHP